MEFIKMYVEPAEVRAWHVVTEIGALACACLGASPFPSIIRTAIIKTVSSFGENLNFVKLIDQRSGRT